MVSTGSRKATFFKLGPDLSPWRGSRALSSTSGLHTLDTNIILPIPPTPPVVTTKNISRHCQMSPRLRVRAKSPQSRST